MSAVSAKSTPQRREDKDPLASDDDPTSSSGSSSSESESESESDEGDSSDEREDADMHDATGPTSTSAPSIPSLAGRPKPNIHRVNGGSDLLSRLSAFLPKLKDANEDLEKEIAAGRGQEMVLDSVDEDGKDYIEMNLGLGVLEEKRDGDPDVLGGEVDDDENAKSDEDKLDADGDSDLLGQLMGGITSSKIKPSIEEMME
ncbi:hypothetical protein N7539_002690 [Penicillium diatomitis]|uniref:Uncharacterized protein n=1 Tax=Penicillium diatomitis TaxID=2819901 RepID=A0A9W9XG28_9EURO|nr:uncharacterized protein N7539_002690 [Penicillium diatomitis]KAJ5491123.1 hypothetical protein N7539_002690 [Penicillium diatomitis]